MSIFAKTIRSNSLQKNPLLRPLTLKISQNLLYDQLAKYLQTNEYESISIAKDYHEVFATKNNIEYTFMIFTEGSNTILSVIVFDEKDTFKKKKILLNQLNELREYFASILM